MGCAFQNGTERSKITCRDMKNHHLCISVIICLLPVNDVTYIERLWFGAIEGCSFFYRARRSLVLILKHINIRASLGYPGPQMVFFVCISYCLRINHSLCKRGSCWQSTDHFGFHIFSNIWNPPPHFILKICFHPPTQ